MCWAQAVPAAAYRSRSLKPLSSPGTTFPQWLPGIVRAWTRGDSRRGQ